MRGGMDVWAAARRLWQWVCGAEPAAACRRLAAEGTDSGSNREWRTGGSKACVLGQVLAPSQTAPHLVATATPGGSEAEPKAC